MNNRPKILLIDDDADFVAATRTVLEAYNYDVVIAYDGEKGIKTAEEVNPDLVLLDVIMPVKNGFTAAEQFKKDPKLSSIPIVMLTSFSTKGQGTGIPMSKGMMLESEDYVEKPISPEELIKKVQQYVGKVDS